MGIGIAITDLMPGIIISTALIFVIIGGIMFIGLNWRKNK